MSLNTLKKLKDYKIFYGDTGQKLLLLTDDDGTALDFTSKDVDLNVYKTQRDLIAENPLFTITADISAPTTGVIGLSIGTVSWALIVDEDFDGNNKLKFLFTLRERDTGAQSNLFTLGKGRFLSEL